MSEYLSAAKMAINLISLINEIEVKVHKCDEALATPNIGEQYKMFYATRKEVLEELQSDLHQVLDNSTTID